MTRPINGGRDMMLRKVFGTAALTIAMVLVAIAPAQASPVVVGGFVYGAFPATVAPDRPTAMNVNFNGSFASLSQVCIGLTFEPASGGEPLTTGEKGIMVVPGGGPGTPFTNNAPDAAQTYKTVCTTDKADLAVFKGGAWQVRFFMHSGSMTVTGASAHALL